MLSKADKARLDAICNEARTRLDAIDDVLYTRGFLTKDPDGCGCAQCTGRKTLAFAPGAGKRFGLNPTAPVPRPSPQPVLPPQRAFAKAS